MNRIFKKNDLVSVFFNNKWLSGMISKVDEKDDARPYLVYIYDTGKEHWVSGDSVGSSGTQKLSSQGNCPICGQRGQFSFNLFLCSNPKCQNYR